MNSIMGVYSLLSFVVAVIIVIYSCLCLAALQPISGQLGSLPLIMFRLNNMITGLQHKPFLLSFPHLTAAGVSLWALHVSVSLFFSSFGWII